MYVQGTQLHKDLSETEDWKPWIKVNYGGRSDSMFPF